MKPSEIPADAPAAVEDLASQFEGSSLDGTITFTLPSKTFGGDPLSGNITYHVLINGVEDFSVEDATPGAQCTEDISLKGGNNQIQVYASNAAGDGPKGKGITLWAGDDVPKAPGNVSLTKKSDNSLSLTWTAPTEGVHGGYMNLNDTKYNITRYPDSLTVATGISATSFSDNVSPAHMKAYKYKVTACGINGEGGSAISNKVKLGPAFEAPYLNAIASQEDFDLFDVYDLNNDGNTWTFEGYEARYKAGSSTGNDLLVSPAVHLTGDRIYTVSFRYRTMGDPEVLGVTYGLANEDPSSYSGEFLADTTLTNRSIDEYSRNIRVSSDGDYSFSFAAKSTSMGWHLDVRKFSVDKGPLLIAPDSVCNLKATAAELGELRATVSFDAPMNRVDGKTLESIGKIEVRNADGNLVATVSSPSVGQKGISVTDAKPVNGYNDYSVVAYDNQGNAGFSASCRVYVGMDQPDVPQNIVAAEGNGEETTVSWDAPTVGIHGGYIESSKLKYTVTRSIGGSQATICDDVSERSVTDRVDQTGDQTTYRYYVVAANEQGKSTSAPSNTMVAGKPFDYPFKESFVGGVLEHKFLVSNHSDMLNWPSESADDDGGCISMMGKGYDNYPIEYFETGKISLANAVSPGLVYSVYEKPGKGHLYVMVYGNNTGWKTVDEVNFGFLFHTSEKWVTHTLMLNEFCNDKYVRIRFLYENDGVNDCMIDNINVRDIHSTNIAVSQLNVPKKVRAGYSTSVGVKVSNIGTESVSNIRLLLSANGHPQDSVTVESIGVNSDAIVNIPTRFLSADKGLVEVSVKASVDGDETLDDNVVSDTTEVSVVDFPKVTDLQGEIVDGRVHLAWTAPYVGSFAPSVTDDVEDYTPWSIDNMGRWTTYDGDGAPSYTIPNSQVQFPNAGTAFGAIVFRPYYIFSRSARNPYTHSGEQCFAMFDAQASKAADTNGYTDDWLISPRLSGNAQTVKFWARSISTTDYEEVFDVLYSTTDSIHSSFAGHAVLKDCKESDGKWHEYSVELPVGAQFFAINLKSKDQFALLIDDISYKPAVPGGKVVVKGYNIYRNMMLVDNVNADVTTFSDMSEGRYQVSAVYGEGESELSNVVSLFTDGISAQHVGCTVSKDDGALLVNGFEGEVITVYGVRGQLIKTAKATGSVRVALPRGAYIVRVGDKTYKLTL